jgi:hypothetical protein
MVQGGLEIARGSVREWYVNGPLGLEQGFTLERAPSCEGTKVVLLEVGGGLVTELVDEKDGPAGPGVRVHAHRRGLDRAAKAHGERRRAQ